MLFDITKALREGLEVYSGHERFSIEKTRTIAEDGYNLSHFQMGAHCGTHLDAPAHFLEGGVSVDQFPVDLMVGYALLVTATASSGFYTVPLGVSHVLIRSGEGFSGLGLEDAEVLIRKGVRVVGTDRLSVAIDGHDKEVHEKLLSNDVWIVENLDLTEPPDGFCEMFCMPLNLSGAEGAPVRVLLRR